jgi:hypothetical protein
MHGVLDVNCEGEYTRNSAKGSERRDPEEPEGIAAAVKNSP